MKYGEPLPNYSRIYPDRARYYQWQSKKHIIKDGVVELTESCSPKLGCPYYSHNPGRFHGVYWAWDRSLGAWVHYAR